jgi:hypothetical protein
MIWVLACPVHRFCTRRAVFTVRFGTMDERLGLGNQHSTLRTLKPLGDMNYEIGNPTRA